MNIMNATKFRVRDFIINRFHRQGLRTYLRGVYFSSERSASKWQSAKEP